MSIESWENEGGNVSGRTVYYLAKSGTEDWKEVSKEEFVRAERRAGFVNTMNKPNEPATGGFSSTWGGMKGRVRYVRDGSE